jgi:hypothetical protein
VPVETVIHGNNPWMGMHIIEIAYKQLFRLWQKKANYNDDKKGRKHATVRQNWRGIDPRADFL